MLKAGLEVADEADAYRELVTINQKALSSRIALKEFTNREEILFAGLDALKTPLPLDAIIYPVPGALQLLASLKEHHTLALVTAGDPALQLQKMEKAGIQPEEFSKLIVGKEPSKKFDYQRVLVELKFDPSEAMVCGDRVEVDLAPAKELGLYTVHFRNGRGLIHDTPKECVDLTINTLKELQEVFVKHET